jgi:uncharacterized protein YjiS (DUF1127 family)
MTGQQDEDQELDRMVRNYHSLSPEQQDVMIRRVIRRARVQRAETIRNLFRSLIDWFRRRAAVTRLQRMDDRMLKDIGLYRGEIEAAVRGEHRPRQPLPASSPAKAGPQGPQHKAAA